MRLSALSLPFDISEDLRLSRKYSRKVGVVTTPPTYDLAAQLPFLALKSNENKSLPFLSPTGKFTRLLPRRAPGLIGVCGTADIFLRLGLLQCERFKLSRSTWNKVG